MTGLSAFPAAERLLRGAREPGVPKYGELHPFKPYLRCLDIDAAFEISEGIPSTDIARYTCHYRLSLFQGTRVSGRTSLVTIQSSFDLEGDPIIVSHTFKDTFLTPEKIPSVGAAYRGGEVVAVRAISEPSKDPRDEGKPSVTGYEIDVQQSGTVSRQFATSVLRAQRKEYAAPSSVQRSFVGRVSSNRFWGDDPGVWLCSAIDWDIGSDALFDVSYEFVQAPTDELWQKVVVLVDGHTGAPARDLVPGEGVKTVTVVGEADFSRMNLGLSTPDPLGVVIPDFYPTIL